jgi:hypothetical protein
MERPVIIGQVSTVLIHFVMHVLGLVADIPAILFRGYIKETKVSNY